MARPQKNNADYHSHDSNMRNDIKIKALRRKYKLTGYAIYNMMLEVLTNSEYFEYEWNDFNIEMLSGDFEIEPDLLKEIVNYCVNVIGVFVIENGKIWSYRHKERFSALLSKRKRDVKGVIDSDNPQSKVKNSIVKESKEYYYVLNGEVKKGNVVDYYLKNHQPNYEALMMQLGISEHDEKVKQELRNYFINGFSFNDYKHIVNSFKKHITEYKAQLLPKKLKMVY